METRFTDETGITINCEKVYSPSRRADVVQWGHFDWNDGRARHVGPWYETKSEILADHENYLKRAGWLK